MNRSDAKIAADLAARLATFSSQRAVPGITAAACEETLVAQLVESVRRANYYPFMRASRRIDPGRANPHGQIFEPLLAAILHQDAGRHDEACWLVFLSVYFGRNRGTAWRLARDVYGALGRKPWTYDRIHRRPTAFRAWLSANETKLKTGPARRFGNHRKYETLSATSPRGTAAAVESYLAWVGSKPNHASLFADAVASAEGDAHAAFDLLYHSMNVASFGRTAKFDYLVMIGKLGLAPIAPGSLYLSGATGPRAGCRLLFGKTLSLRDLDARSIELAKSLNVATHVLEDALCNWQKSPASLVRFRG